MSRCVVIGGTSPDVRTWYPCMEKRSCKPPRIMANLQRLSSTPELSAPVKWRMIQQEER
jgi:hypothetical protein